MSLIRPFVVCVTNGRITKAERAKAKHKTEVGRKLIAELKEIEKWALDHGHLGKNWQDQFK